MNETRYIRTKGKDFTYNLIDGKLVSRTCSKCMVVKEVCDFSVSKGKYLGYYPVCKPCLSLEYKERYAGDVEGYSEKNRLRYSNNSEPTKARSKKWRQDNPEVYNEYMYARERDKRQRILTKEYLPEIRRVYEECRHISESTQEDLSVDHIIPLKGKNVSGLHVPWNMQILKASHNKKKNNKFDGTYENNSWKKGLKDE